MAAGKRTDPALEAEVVRLVREGQSRRQVSVTTGLHVSTVSRIVRSTPGLEFAQVGGGSNGTPEGAAKARGYRSVYAKNRRDAIAEKLLDRADGAADRAATAENARDFNLFMQGGDAAIRAYDKITKTDQAGDGGAAEAKSVMGHLILALSATVGENGAREGLVTE